MPECTRTCVCGHMDNQHEDIGDLMDKQWGEGKCQWCECPKFRCDCMVKENPVQLYPVRR